MRKIYTEEPRYAEVCGTLVPDIFASAGEDYQAIRQNIAILPGDGYCALQIAGEGAEDLLESLVAKDVRYLMPGKALESFILDEDASVVGNVIVVNQGEGYLLLSAYENAPEVRNFIGRKNQGSQIVDLLEDHTLFFLEGPTSWKLIRQILGVDVESVALRDMIDFTYQGSKVVLIRIGRSTEYAYCFLAEDSVVDSLIAAIRSFDGAKVSFAGKAALDVCMIETGYPITTETIMNHGNLLELGYQWLIQYEKEEFSGREKLMDLFHAGVEKEKILFIFEGEADLTGKTVRFEGEKVGEILVSAYDSAISKTIGYALLKKNFAAAGVEYTLDEGVIRSVSSPVIRPLSWSLAME